MWALLDMLTAMAGGFLALLFQSDLALTQGRLAQGAFPSLLESKSGLAVACFSLCLVIFSNAFGLYGPVQYRSAIVEQRSSFQAAMISGLLLCGSIYLVKGESVSRVVLVLSVLITAVMLGVRRALWRSMLYRRYRNGLDTRNILIVGSGRVGRALRNHVESLHHLGLRFRGFIALDGAGHSGADADVVGKLSDCLSVARALFIDEVFFSVPAGNKVVVRLVQEARELGIDVRVVPDLYEGLALNASMEYVGQFPTIPLHRRESPIGALLLKRVLDLTLSSLALLLLSPVLLVIAISVRVGSPGPVLYRAPRIGRKGRMFQCLKFRTMVMNADKMKENLSHLNERDGILFKMSNDPRITRVGRLLRKYSLDEIPQFLNVLKGEMSLVGPRPPIASEVARYDLAHLQRLDVLPGITGLWQVEARQDPSFDSYISLDTAYVENWTLWLDCKIMFRTITVVLGGTGS